MEKIAFWKIFGATLLAVIICAAIAYGGLKIYKQQKDKYKTSKDTLLDDLVKGANELKSTSKE